MLVWPRTRSLNFVQGGENCLQPCKLQMTICQLANAVLHRGDVVHHIVLPEQKLHLRLHSKLYSNIIEYSEVLLSPS